MRHPTQGATSGWVMLGLVFLWFLLCEFSLFDNPFRVSSLVVLGLGVCALTPKAQGLIYVKPRRKVFDDRSLGSWFCPPVRCRDLSPFVCVGDPQQSQGLLVPPQEL